MCKFKARSMFCSTHTHREPTLCVDIMFLVTNDRRVSQNRLPHVLVPVIIIYYYLY